MKLETQFKGDLRHWPYTHPSMPSDTYLDYYGTDNQQLYERNLKYNLDWIYVDKKVKYYFNKQNLRMDKNLEQVDNDYIYFSGTSYTMGIGINTEDRYSERVSHILNKDFINCSGPTYSIKAQFISFTNFLNTGYKLPKIFVIEYPPSYAYTYYNEEHFLFYYTKNIPEQHNNYLTAYKELLNTDYYVNEALIYRDNIMGTCKRLGIKYCEISFHKQDIFSKYLHTVDTDTNSDDINYCYGRDLRVDNGHYSGHPGIGIHKLASDAILNQL